MNGVIVSVEKGEIKFTVEKLPEPTLPCPSYALVKIMSAGLCESDIGYYNDRLKNALADTNQIQRNVEFLRHTAIYQCDNRELFKLLRAQGHEGWGIITNANITKNTYVLAILEPKLKNKRLIDVKYKTIDYKPKYTEGDWVIISPAQRCEYHDQIGKDGWASKECNRQQTLEHPFTKKVTGHLEYPGLTVDGVVSLHESMLYMVPPRLKRWLENNGELKHLLVYAEPLGCVIDALKDLIRHYWEKDKSAKNCLIFGDGPNGMLITSTIKTLMPKYQVTVLGFHDEKLEIIEKAGADKIFNTYQFSNNQIYETIKTDKKYDIVVSTVPLTNFRYLDDLLSNDVELILWATEVQNQPLYFKNKDKIQKPYGGINGGEYNAVLTMDAIMKTHPEYLKAWQAFPTVRSQIFFASDMYQTWYKYQGGYPGKRRLGKLMVVM